MSEKPKKRTTVGRRTGVDIVPSKKTLKLNKDGLESFSDYWQSSDSLNLSSSHMISSPICKDVERISSFFGKNISGAKRERISFINPFNSTQQSKESNVENPPNEQLKDKTNFNVSNHSDKLLEDSPKGRRTGINIIAGKEIQVEQSIEDFKGYWTVTHSEVNNTGIDKISSSRRLLRSGSSKLNQKSFSPIVIMERNDELNEDVTKVDGNNSTDSVITKKSPEKNVKLGYIQTSVAPPDSHSVENSEVTSTTVDFINSKTNSVVSSPLTPRSLRSRSPKNLHFSKDDAGDTFHNKIDASSRSLENTPVKSSITTIQYSTPSRVNKKITKYGKKSFQDLVLGDATSINLCNENMSPKCKNTTFPISEQEKTLSTEDDEIPPIAPNGTFSKSEKENINGKVKNSEVQKPEWTSLSTSLSIHNNKMDRSQTLNTDASTKNSNKEASSNHIEKTLKSTEFKSRMVKHKKTLSVSGNRDEIDETQNLVSDCISSTSGIVKKKTSLSASPIKINEIYSIAPNGTFSTGEVENSNKNEKIKNSEVQEEELISFSASLPLHNNKMDRSQTLNNDLSTSNSHKATSSNQIEKTPKSTEFKSQIGKHKKTLSSSKNRDEIDQDQTLVSEYISSTPQVVKLKKTSLPASLRNVNEDEIQCGFSNSTLFRDESKTTDKNEKTKKFTLQKQNQSLSPCSQNNEAKKIQTLVKDASSEISYEEMNATQLVKNPKATDSKSRIGKCKKNSRKGTKAGTKRDQLTAKLKNPKSKFGRKIRTSASSEVEIDATTESFHEASNSAMNKIAETKKRKSPSSTVSSLNNVKKKNSSGMNELRRSKRVRIAPLESWRLERRMFGYKNGELINLGYEKGFPEDKSCVNAILKRYEKTKEKKKPQKKDLKLNDNSINMELIQSNIGKTKVTNPFTGGDEYVYLHRPYNSLLWSIPPSLDDKDPSYTITKSMSGELISFGYIEIEVSKQKDEQISPSDNITFTVIKGRVKICVNKQDLKLKELDKMTVPSGNGYSIKNIGKVPALLSFCTYKVPLFDYQFSEMSDETA